jgi:hypothetical protein
MNPDWVCTYPDVTDYVLYYSDENKMTIISRENGNLPANREYSRIFKDNDGSPKTFESLDDARIFLNTNFKREYISSQYLLNYQQIMEGFML